MSEQLYDLVIDGVDKAGDIAAIKQQISTVCQLSQAAVDRAITELLAGLRRAVVVKKNLPKPVAEQLKAILEQKGLKCRLAEPLGLIPVEVTVEKKEYVCPACDHRQPLTEVGEDAQCANCGVVKSKYLKYEKARKTIEREKRLIEAKEQYELEKQSQDENLRQEKEIASRVRKQHRLNSVRGFTGFIRANSVLAKATAIILTIGTIPLSYLVYHNYNKGEDVEQKREQAINAVSAPEQLPPDESVHISEKPQGVDSPGDGPAQVALSIESGVAGPVSIDMAVGGIPSGSGDEVSEGSGSEMSGEVTGASLASDDAAEEQTGTGHSEVATEISGEAGHKTKGLTDSGEHTAAEESTPTEVTTGDSDATVPSSVSQSRVSDKGDLDAKIASRQTLANAVSVASGVADAGGRAIALGAIASLQTQMGHITAAQETLMQAREVVKTGGSTADYTAAINEVAKASCELSAAIALSQQNGDNRSSQQALAGAIEAAKGIAGMHERVAALSTIAKYMAQAGQFPAAQKLFNEVFAITTTITSRHEYVGALGDIAANLLEAGDMASAQQVINEMWDNAKRISNIQDRLAAFSVVAAKMSASEGGTATAQQLLTDVYKVAEGIEDPDERASLLDTINTSRVQSLSKVAGRLAQSGDGNGAHKTFEQAMSAAAKIKNTGQKIGALASIAKEEASVPVRKAQGKLLTAVNQDVAAPTSAATGLRSVLSPASRLSQSRDLEISQ